CIIIYVLVSLTGMTIQFFNPEYLITSIGVTVMILGIYLSYEDPALKELSEYYSETVMSFANLVENRDSSTGGHIKRTTQYVRLIAQNLQKRGYYKDILTKDFISDMEKAAPLHDIGKISVPDAVLQKPGKLTDEEFAVMKKHAENGGTIIRESFEKLGNDEYAEMAYEVARYHHEKWNGRGYPEGLSGEKIPLCARIMAVADVFDAVSEKRCYRDAMPLEQCFDIIRKGTGEDFDPLIANVFLEIKDAVEEVHRSFAQNK
ncbi:HD domain-containing phosphohydrolase, partial [uncultured Treponema sp.]